MKRFLGTSLVTLGIAAFASTAQADDSTTTGCGLGAHPGVDEADARTSAEVVCHELAKRGDTRPRELRMGRLGNRILLMVSSPEGATEDKRLLVDSFEEIPTAAARLADAATEHRAIEETQKVDSVVGEETRSSRVKPGQIGLKASLMGAMPVIGASTGTAPGGALGLLYRAGRLGIDGQVRGGGGGTTSTTLRHFAFGVGTHYYFTDRDFSPYAGGGLALLHYKLGREDDRQSIGNTGVGAYVEIGVEALRTHHASFTLGLRADVPMFALAHVSADSAYGVGRYATPRPESQYILPLSLAAGVLFH